MIQYIFPKEINTLVIVVFPPLIKCLEGGRLVVACYLIEFWMVISH